MKQLDYPWGERRLDHMVGIERMWTYKFRGISYPYIARWLDDEWARISGRKHDSISYKDGHIVYRIDWKRDGFPDGKDNDPRGMMEATGALIGDVQRLIIDKLDTDLELFREQCAPCDPESKEMIESGDVWRIEHYPKTRGPNLKTWGLGWHYLDGCWQNAIDEHFAKTHEDEHEVHYRHHLAPSWN